jgi:hypothetical protein
MAEINTYQGTTSVVPDSGFVSGHDFSRADDNGWNQGL